MKQFVITDINGNVHMVLGDDWDWHEDMLVITYMRRSVAIYRWNVIIGFEIRN